MFSALFRQDDVPLDYRSNFWHLYQDMGWFGVLSGSALNFQTVYAARLGASPVQIGLLAAVAAVVSLLLAIPSARWIEQRSVARVVFRTSVFYRLGFALWIPLPWLFPAQGQIWALILIALYMGVPLTALSVGFNALFAGAVPADWRAHVAAVRNVVFSVSFMLSSLVSGYILKNMPFPLGYQLIFLIGFLGAAMSSFHLYFIHPLQADAPPLPPEPEDKPSLDTEPRPWLWALRLDIWKTPFRRNLLVLLGFHLSQYLAIPLFSIYMVRELRLSDEVIGIGTALFYLAVLLGSTQLRRVVQKAGHKAITGYGVLGMGLYPILMALSSQVWHFYVLSFLGGLAWALVGGAYANYLLENTPAHDRPSHLAWYNMVLNAAVLFGSLAGPAFAESIGLAAALLIFGALRFLAGAAILKWG
ncbi:MAG TPA: MFS transporter [Anaerolineales bacterium]